MLLRFENFKFCKTEYKLSALQVSNLLIVWIELMEVSVRHQKHHYNVIMTSFVTTEFSN